MDTRSTSILAGPATPEDLDLLLEDTLVLRDPEGLTNLFEPGAVLVSDGGTAQGRDAIQRLAFTIWSGDQLYVAAPQRVVQARDLALLFTRQTVAVARQGGDGTWRYGMIVATRSPDEGSRR